MDAWAVDSCVQHASQPATYWPHRSQRGRTSQPYFPRAVRAAPSAHTFDDSASLVSAISFSRGAFLAARRMEERKFADVFGSRADERRNDDGSRRRYRPSPPQKASRAWEELARLLP